MLKKEILLSYFPKITSRRFQQLYAVFSSLDNAWEAEFDDFKGMGWDDQLTHEFLSWRDDLNEDEIEEQLQQEGIQCITRDHPKYPPLLQQIYEPPFCLFVRGTLEPTDIFLGVVGTRKNTAYGRQVAYEFVHTLAQKNIAIVSGLAFGIDSYAHKTSLQVNGKTIAVLGSGVDRKSVYPAAHQQLGEAIIAGGGALVSEYPPGTKPTKYTFPKRNRIIAGMSVGTLVIEAPKSSGALITAECAVNNNREVFAVPQNITADNAVGPNNLLKQGACLVTSPEDILDELNIPKTKKQPTQLTLDNPEEQAVLSSLSREPKHIDTLHKTLDLSSDIITSTLTMLEMKGMVKHLGSMMYIRTSE